jgi:hypothetical protein
LDLPWLGWHGLRWLRSDEIRTANGPTPGRKDGIRRISEVEGKIGRFLFGWIETGCAMSFGTANPWKIPIPLFFSETAAKRAITARLARLSPKQGNARRNIFNPKKREAYGEFVTLSTPEPKSNPLRNSSGTGAGFDFGLSGNVAVSFPHRFPPFRSVGECGILSPRSV